MAMRVKVELYDDDALIQSAEAAIDPARGLLEAVDAAKGRLVTLCAVEACVGVMLRQKLDEMAASES